MYTALYYVLIPRGILLLTLIIALLTPAAYQARAAMVGLGEQVILRGASVNASDSFGTSMALDGDTLAIGAPGKEVVGTETSNAGAVYIFRRENGSWVEQAVLQASNAQDGDSFGSQVALKGDTLAVAARREDGVNNAVTDAGAVYIFVRTNATWTEQAIVRASNTESFDLFGFAIALDHDLLAVGAPLEDHASNLRQAAGATYVFTRQNGVWTEQKILRASDAEMDDWFGTSIALQNNTLIVGASHASDDAGAVYVFNKINTTWHQQTILEASNGEAEDYFGHSLAFDANTLVVGATHEDGQANNLVQAGAAYVFIQGTDNSWGEQTVLRAFDANPFDSFGASVAVAGDRIVVGARSADGATNLMPDAGAAYVFTRDTANWREQATLYAANPGSEDQFGDSVAVADTTVVVGAPNEAGSDDTIEQAGAAYVFETVINQAPVAVADADQTVAPESLVTLNGSASSDPDDDMLSHTWTQTAGPPVTLSGATTAMPTFTAPAAPAVLTFELQVSDPAGAESTDMVTITVEESPHWSIVLPMVRK